MADKFFFDVGYIKHGRVLSLGTFHAKDKAAALERMLHVKGVKARWQFGQTPGGKGKAKLVFENDVDRSIWGEKRWVVVEHGAKASKDPRVPVGGRSAKVIGLERWRLNRKMATVWVPAKNAGNQ
tara:strand:+ start:241 stop:615 length:375 start_codon:yes stop_codon:yes gene_type:complete